MRIAEQLQKKLSAYLVGNDSARKNDSVWRDIRLDKPPAETMVLLYVRDEYHVGYLGYYGRRWKEPLWLNDIGYDGYWTDLPQPPLQITKRTHK